MIENFQSLNISAVDGGLLTVKENVPSRLEAGPGYFRGLGQGAQEGVREHTPGGGFCDRPQSVSFDSKRQIGLSPANHIGAQGSIVGGDNSQGSFSSPG